MSQNQEARKRMTAILRAAGDPGYSEHSRAALGRRPSTAAPNYLSPMIDRLANSTERLTGTREDHEALAEWCDGCARRRAVTWDYGVALCDRCNQMDEREIA